MRHAAVLQHGITRNDTQLPELREIHENVVVQTAHKKAFAGSSLRFSNGNTAIDFVVWSGTSIEQNNKQTNEKRRCRRAQTGDDWIASDPSF